MPAPANPRNRDFFVYTFRADGYPFYVGIGRDRRASDRLRYVRSLTSAELKEKSLSVRVMADLAKKACIKFSCTRTPLNRSQALALEKKENRAAYTKGIPTNKLATQSVPTQRYNQGRKSSSAQGTGQRMRTETNSHIDHQS
jgi:hypothetical protein